MGNGGRSDSFHSIRSFEFLHVKVSNLSDLSIFDRLPSLRERFLSAVSFTAASVSFKSLSESSLLSSTVALQESSELVLLV